MTPTIVEFTASGTARAMAAAIEAYAATRRAVSALVVPWESDAVTLRMAVTSMNGDGWAIEHTNLGTISLVGLGGDLIRVAVTASDTAGEDLPDREIRDQRTAVLTAFARQIERKFAVVSPAIDESRTP